MFRILSVLLLAACVFGCSQPTASPVPAAVNTTASSEPTENSGELLNHEALAAYQADPTDVSPLIDFANANFKQITTDFQSDPAAAEKHADQFLDVIQGLPAEFPEAEGVLIEIEESLFQLKLQLVALRTTFEEIKQRIVRNPDDSESIKMFEAKVEYEIYQLLDDDVDAAHELLVRYVDFIGEQQAKSTETVAKIAYQQLASTMVSSGQTIIREKSNLSVRGKSMIPLDVESWVNGEPESLETLQGKVVILDFWAIWCGPCIESMPELIEWQKKYEEQGLQVIGITSFFNILWAEGEPSPVQLDPEELEVSPEEEIQALNQFAEVQEMNYPTAVMSKQSKLSLYYGHTLVMNAIGPNGVSQPRPQAMYPHLVVIGRDGVVRKVSTGLGGKTSEKIEALIEELLAEPVPEKTEEAAAESNEESETKEPGKKPIKEEPKESDEDSAKEMTKTPEPEEAKEEASQPKEEEPATEADSEAKQDSETEPSPEAASESEEPADDSATKE